MDGIVQIQIQNKLGRIVIVPLKTWENGLKLDSDWHIYEPPKVKEQPVAPVTVKVTPAPVPPAAAPIRPAPPAKPKGRKKGK